MKKILILIFCLTYEYGMTQTVHPQNCTDSSNMYCISLKKHLEYLERTGGFDKQNAKPYEVNVIESNSITEDLPEKIGYFNIHYLDNSNIRDKIKKKERINVLEIKPVNIKNNLAEIAVIDFSVNYEKKRLMFANTGNSEIEFNYDCLINCFIFNKIKYISF